MELIPTLGFMGFIDRALLCWNMAGWLWDIILGMYITTNLEYYGLEYPSILVFSRSILLFYPFDQY